VLLLNVSLTLNDRKKRRCCLEDSPNHTNESHDGTKGDIPCPDEDQASSPDICSKGEDPHGPFKVESSVKSSRYIVHLEGFIK